MNKSVSSDSPSFVVGTRCRQYGESSLKSSGLLPFDVSDWAPLWAHSQFDSSGSASLRSARKSVDRGHIKSGTRSTGPPSESSPKFLCLLCS